jgi:hypothetical protein
VFCYKIKIKIQSLNIILPVVLYGFEASSLKGREERRLRVLESRVLKKVFGPKWEELTGGWRTLYNEELLDSYSSQNIIKLIKQTKVRWLRHVTRMGKKNNASTLLVGQTEGRKQIARERPEWEIIFNLF